MSTRVIRAYRTVSYATVMILAMWPPLEYLAAMYSKMYWQGRELRGSQETEPGFGRPSRTAVYGGEVGRPPLQPEHSGSEDHRSCSALSSGMAIQGSGGGYLPLDAGAHRARLL